MYYCLRRSSRTHIGSKKGHLLCEQENKCENSVYVTFSLFENVKYIYWL